MADEPRSPAVDKATITKLKAEAAHLDALQRKEVALAEAAELDLQAKRRAQRFAEAKDAEHRVYQFTSQVGDTSVEACMATLAAWTRLGHEPITLCLNSPGGSVLHGLRLYDFLRTLVEQHAVPVTTITLGYAASMAGILFQAGSDRVVAPNAYVLVHEVSAGAIGKIGDLEDTVDFVKKLNDRLFSILASRATVSKAALLNRAKRKDYWIDAETVLKLGLADRIGFS